MKVIAIVIGVIIGLLILGISVPGGSYAQVQTLTPCPTGRPFYEMGACSFGTIATSDPSGEGTPIINPHGTPRTVYVPTWFISDMALGDPPVTPIVEQR